ncbi:MAG: hypothetical protein NTY48_00195 [Candidatus Diapherotrites archaeon]|nr:hypothetical protein [Candidatus Diapherotrites archaeon]
MAEEKKQAQISEQQLLQMAQREEQNLYSKQTVAAKATNILVETITAKEILKEMKTHKGKMNIAIGGTIMIEVAPIGTDKCKRGIGEQAYKEETIDETIKWLEEKEEQMKNHLNGVQKELAASEARLIEYTSVLKQIEQEKRSLMNQMPPTISK